MRARHRERGFTLLEAIVALAILGAVLVPLYALVANSANALFRARDQARIASETLNALAWLETLNPAERNAGEAALGEIRLRWRSSPLVAPVIGANYPVGSGAFGIGLYTVDVELRERDGRVLTSFRARRAGWEGALR